MKKYISFIVLAGLVLSFSVALAEDTGGVNFGKPPLRPLILKEKREDLKNEMEARREALKEKIETEREAFHNKLKTDRELFLADLKTKKDEFKTAKAENKLEFCRKARGMTIERFEVAIAQLEKIQTKIGEIITKLTIEGKDTTLATTSLNLSKQKLTEVKTKLLEIKNLTPGDCKNMTPEVFEKIKLLAREAKDLLKESRESLHGAIKAIKDLREDNKNED